MIEILKFSATWCGPCRVLSSILKDVEGIVLPTWRVHGKQLLADSGVDFATLQAQGMPASEIEKLPS